MIASAPADFSLVQNQIEIIQSRNSSSKSRPALNLKDDVELVPEVPDLSERVQTWLTQSIDLPSAIVEMLGGLRSRRAASIWATADELKTERALNSLRGKLSVKRVGSSHTILIAFKHSDPNKAANIVNADRPSLSAGRAQHDRGCAFRKHGVAGAHKGSRSECTHNIRGCSSDPPRWPNRPLDRHHRYGAWVRLGRWNSLSKSVYGSHDPHTRAGHIPRWS